MLDRYRISICLGGPIGVNWDPNSHDIPWVKFECIELISNPVLLEVMKHVIQRQLNNLEENGFEPKRIVMNTRCYEQLILDVSIKNVSFVEQCYGLDVIVVPNGNIEVICDGETELCHAKKLKEIRRKSYEEI